MKTRHAQRVVHLTTTHRADDPRIALKECTTLARAGYHVVLITPYHEGVAAPQGVTHVTIGKGGGRGWRLGVAWWRGLLQALLLRPAAIHVHDPEFMAVGPFVRAAGVKFIFDAHEHFSIDVLQRRSRTPRVVREVAARLMRLLERLVGISANAVVGVDDSMMSRFRARRFLTLRNYPIRSAMAGDTGRRRELTVFTGGLGSDRFAGLLAEVGEALAEARGYGVTVAGRLSSPELGGHWGEMGFGDYVGMLSRQQLESLLNRSRVGLALIPESDSRPSLSTTKIYEYLAFGVPVVATRVPAWFGEFGNSPAFHWIESNCRDEIVRQVVALEDEAVWREASDAARRLGERYTWSSQEAGLVGLYDSLLRCSR